MRQRHPLPGALRLRLGDLVKEECFCVETLAGSSGRGSGSEGTARCSVEVDRGAPVLERAMIPMTGPKGRVLDEPLDTNMGAVRLSMVRMGVPHAVVFVDDIGLCRRRGAREGGGDAPRRSRKGPTSISSRSSAKARSRCARGNAAQAPPSRAAPASARAPWPRTFWGAQRKGSGSGSSWARSKSILAKDGRVLMKGPAQYVFEGEYQL